MLRYDPFYFQCPNCHSWLEGRNLKSDLVNEAILYSDGKILYDNYITTRQKMILCPACAHTFWVENPDNTSVVTSKERPDHYVYSWNTWRFYGINFSDNKGKLALINHYLDFLSKTHFEPSKEIYLRRMLWWAYNDLHRNHQHTRLKYLINGFMSYGVWHHNRMTIFGGEKLFIENMKGFNENLERLLTLLEKHPEEQLDLEMPEIHRELRHYNKTIELLEQSGSHTHFTNEMMRLAKRKDPRVFMVSG